VLRPDWRHVSGLCSETMGTDSPRHMERLASRRSGVLAMIVGMSFVLLGAYLSVEGGSPSPKANATLFLSGAAGFVIVLLAPSARDLTRGDRVRIGVLLCLSVVTMLAVDFGVVLQGGARVATPLVVGIVLGLTKLRR